MWCNKVYAYVPYKSRRFPFQVEAESRFQVRCNNLKVEVRKREDIIHQLLERLRQLEVINFALNIFSNFIPKTNKCNI